MRRQILSLLLLPLLLAGCSTPGTFFKPLQGPHFKAQALPDEDNALVYLYRPQSDWGDQELEAPGVFLNNELIGVLPSGGYLALEFDVDNYRLEMRRPLFGSYWTLFADGPLEFTRIASFTLEAETGAVYYLRYDELNPPPAKDTQPEEGDGPLQVVGERLGLEELPATRLVQDSQHYAAGSYAQRPQRSFWEGVGKALDHIGI